MLAHVFVSFYKNKKKSIAGTFCVLRQQRGSRRVSWTEGCLRQTDRGSFTLRVRVSVCQNSYLLTVASIHVNACPAPPHIVRAFDSLHIFKCISLFPSPDFYHVCAGFAGRHVFHARRLSGSTPSSEIPPNSYPQLHTVSADNEPKPAPRLSYRTSFRLHFSLLLIT